MRLGPLNLRHFENVISLSVGLMQYVIQYVLRLETAICMCTTSCFWETSCFVMYHTNNQTGPQVVVVLIEELHVALTSLLTGTCPIAVLRVHEREQLSIIILTISQMFFSSIDVPRTRHTRADERYDQWGSWER